MKDQFGYPALLPKNISLSTLLQGFIKMTAPYQFDKE
jgi:hypothetical protein